ncbi:FAD:protein FMN transferase [Sphingomonas sp. I4]
MAIPGGSISKPRRVPTWPRCAWRCTRWRWRAAAPIARGAWHRPRTGYPPTNGVIGVHVIASTAMLADALATAVAVSYPDLSPLAPMQVAARILVRRGDMVEEVMTEPLKAMLG